MQTNVKIKITSLFSPGFFDIKGVFTIRNIAVMGMMVALSAVLRRFTTIYIYIPGPTKLTDFAYFPGIIVAMFYGPWAALVFGIASDTVGYLANSSGGGYFFGYALSEMVSCFIYASFLYKHPAKIWRIAAARALILVIVSFGMHFIWMSMMSGNAVGSVFGTTRVIINLVQFPVHVFLITFVLQYMLKIKPVSKILTEKS